MESRFFDIYSSNDDSMINEKRRNSHFSSSQFMTGFETSFPSSSSSFSNEIESETIFENETNSNEPYDLISTQDIFEENFTDAIRFYQIDNEVFPDSTEIQFQNLDHLIFDENDIQPFYYVQGELPNDVDIYSNNEDEDDEIRDLQDFDDENTLPVPGPSSSNTSSANNKKQNKSLIQLNNEYKAIPKPIEPKKNIPQNMIFAFSYVTPATATIEKAYPQLNFKQVDFITVAIPEPSHQRQIEESRLVVTQESDFTFSEVIPFLFDLSTPVPDFIGFKSSNSFFVDGMSSNRRAEYNEFDEKLIPFEEFPDRTFESLGTSDIQKFENFIPSQRRGVYLSCERLIDLLDQDPSSILLIDARFAYEAQGGNFKKSFKWINIDRFWDIKRIFNALWYSGPTKTSRYPKKIIVIYGELSVWRAPGLYRNILLLDHARLLFANIQSISFPEIYVLDGGYFSLHNYLRKKNLHEKYLESGSDESILYTPRFSKPHDEYLSYRLGTYSMQKENLFLDFTDIDLPVILGYFWNPFLIHENDYFKDFKKSITLQSSQKSKKRDRTISSQNPSSSKQRLGSFI